MNNKAVGALQNEDDKQGKKQDCELYRNKDKRLQQKREVDGKKKKNYIKHKEKMKK